jgi:hypothetical protein
MERWQLPLPPMLGAFFLLLLSLPVMRWQEVAPLRIHVIKPMNAGVLRLSPNDNLFRVVVLKDALHGKTIGDEDLQRQVAHIAAYSLQMSVLVSCADDSPHRLLMRVLDICASNGLTNIKVDNM